MRVLVWQEVFGDRPGGIQTVTDSLLPGLRRCGHDLLIVSRRDRGDLPGESAWNGIPVHRLPLWQALAKADLAAIVALRREIERLAEGFAPDLVHLHSFGPTALYHLETRRTGAPPLLVTLHSSNVLTSGTATVVRRTLRAAGWTVGCSHAVLEQARRIAPEIVGRSSVVHNGADPPPLAPASLPLEEPRVLCLGWLAADKGFDLAVRACAAVRVRFPRLRLVVAGEGPESTRLQAQAAEDGLAGAADFVGVVPHAAVPALLNAATVVVLPSRREAFSLVALEAALMARPVVACRVGGLPEIVVHGETGLLVEPESAAAIAEAIGFLLAHPEAAARMGRAAQERAVREFGAERQLQAYDRLYHMLAGPERRPP